MILTVYVLYCILQAGGKASTGFGRIMNVRPKSLHDHVPCIMGSYDDVTEVELYYSSDRS